MALAPEPLHNSDIHAHIGQWSWYVFNVADAAIVCGVAALILESQFLRRSHVTRHGSA